MKNALKIVSTLVISFACWSVNAEGVEVMRRTYQETPRLPISPASQMTAPSNVQAALTGQAQVTRDAATTDETIRKVIELLALAAAKVAPVNAAPVTPEVKAIKFEVVATDRNVREVLQRWAGAAGWKHDQIHWTLSRDFPIEGTASADYFKGDFKSAVRTLLSSTQTTDLPAQPCFYTNHIIRVVPQAELCDRLATNTQ